MAVRLRAIKVAITCVSLAFSGCYEVKEPIITPEMAEKVPGLEGQIFGSEGDRYVFIYHSKSRTYSIWESGGGNLKHELSRVLVIPLRDNFYWFQAQKINSENSPRYYLWLSKFESKKRLLTEFHAPDMTEAALREFAGKFGIKINHSILIGSRADILEFMKAHSHVRLKELHGP